MVMCVYIGRVYSIDSYKISYFVASYKVIYIYIYTHALFYTLGVEYYYTPSCYTEQNSVMFSSRVSVLFSISCYCA
jgi:hypothetical protein